MRKLYLLMGLLPLIMVSAGCKKKDRLAANSFFFAVSPAAVQLLVNGTQTFKAQSAVDSSPEWTVSASSVATINTTLGSEVTLTAQGLGDVVLTATVDGVSASARIAVSDSFSPGTSGKFDVYTDQGLPPDVSGSLDSDIQIDAIFQTPTSINEEDGTDYTPEGQKFFRTNRPSPATNAIMNWRVTLDAAGQNYSKDLSAFSSGSLKFWFKINRALINGGGGEDIKIHIISDGIAAAVINPLNATHGFDRTSTAWQEITIPIASFGYSNAQLAQIEAPFGIEANDLGDGSVNPLLIFDVDAIRWE